jgi:hypothetical protein
MLGEENLTAILLIKTSLQGDSHKTEKVSSELYPVRNIARPDNYV